MTATKKDVSNVSKYGHVGKITRSKKKVVSKVVEHFSLPEPVPRQVIRIGELETWSSEPDGIN